MIGIALLAGICLPFLLMASDNPKWVTFVVIVTISIMVASIYYGLKYDPVDPWGGNLKYNY